MEMLFNLLASTLQSLTLKITAKIASPNATGSINATLASGDATRTQLCAFLAGQHVLMACVTCLQSF